MDEIEQTDDTMRQRILDAIIARYEALDEPDWPLKFGSVEQGPLGEADARKRYTMGVVAGREQYSNSFPFTERKMQVALEFRVTVNRGDPQPARLFEKLLGVVERAIGTDHTWGGLATKTDFVNNEQDLTTYEDKSVIGVLFIVVHYRHAHNDPRNPHPDDY